MSEIWISTAYFGPISYFRAISGADRVNLEACESYERQSWRNRCRILSANGILDLSVPVVQGHTPSQPIRDVRIDHSRNWHTLHFRSIESAYRRSPYYEFLIDELIKFWQRKETFLFDLNLSITEKIIRLTGAEPEIVLTDHYEKPGSYGEADLRYSFHPKQKKGTGLMPMPYHQVFSERFGFVPDLSILDWLFNCFRT